MPAQPKPQRLQELDLQRGRRRQFDQRNYRKFVRGGGGIAAAGVARNYSKYFGLRVDFQWDNLPLRNSALQLAQAPGATSYVYSFPFDPIVNIPVSTKRGVDTFSAGQLTTTDPASSIRRRAIPGSACNPFFAWWGPCFNASLPSNGNFLHASMNQFGENFGGGVTRKIRPNIELYAEFRYLHGARSGITTDLRPITIGLRW